MSAWRKILSWLVFPTLVGTLAYVPMHVSGADIAGALGLAAQAGEPLVYFAVVATGFTLLALLERVLNIDLRTGPFTWLFSTPELHRWHHSTDPREGNANYGAVLNVWDHVFGTFFWPRRRRFAGPVGIAAMPHFPRGYLGQLASPFRWTRLGAGDEVLPGNLRKKLLSRRAEHWTQVAGLDTGRISCHAPLSTNGRGGG